MFATLSDILHFVLHGFNILEVLLGISSFKHKFRLIQIPSKMKVLNNHINAYSGEISLIPHSLQFLHIQPKFGSV